jgi:hypothetical protein
MKQQSNDGDNDNDEKKKKSFGLLFEPTVYLNNKFISNICKQR